MSDKVGNISFKDWDICKEEIKKLNIFDLGIVLQLIPSDTSNEEHKEIVETAIQKFASELFKDLHQCDSENDTNYSVNLYGLRLNVFRQMSKFLLNRKTSEIDKYIAPILKSLMATEETAFVY